MLALTDTEDLAKTRRALVVVASFTILVANATILSDRLSIFGLEITFDQAQVVLLGRISLASLLLILTFHLIDAAFSTGIKINNDFDAKWESLAKYENHEMERQNQYDSYDGSEPDNWDVHFANEQNRRAKRALRLQLIATGFTSAKFIIIRDAPTVAISIIAAIDPNLFGQVLQNLT
ncbi:MAG: hypothetical protein ACJAQU_001816 [Loktanella salsilacus]|jgi:hypothetical protein